MQQDSQSLPEEHLTEETSQPLRELATLTRDNVAFFGIVVHAICLGGLGTLPLGVCLCVK